MCIVLKSNMEILNLQDIILIVDFGSQTTHLIGRRLRDLGAKIKIVNPEDVLFEIKKENPKGIILSGGPASVYEKGAPTIDKKIYDSNIPILGICYGFQLTSFLLGGKVISGRKEYGPARLELGIKKYELGIMDRVKNNSTIWMSHGDEIIKLPEDFKIIGSTEQVKSAVAINLKRKLYLLQFHPEIEHTEEGNKILENFLKICGIFPAIPTSNGIATSLSKKANLVVKMTENIRATVGENYVIGAVSGGVDSTVAGVLVASAIGKHFIPIFVDNGLMRDGAILNLNNVFSKFGVKLKVVQCKKETLKRLKGIIDSEEKRKVIGKFYIEVFEREMKKLINKNYDVQFLLQGTIFSDVIESKGSKHAAKIKSHHNVGGLPKNMKLKLLEPLKELYKDEVRELGKALGLSEKFIMKQPFPGPGYAIRIRGEVTVERLKKEKQADKIVLSELDKANVLDKIFISFPVMTGATSTAVKGDGRFMGEVIALRIIESKDIMSSTWSRLPYDLLQTISSRIVNEVPGISRVVYDITTKPPSTMEWE